VTTAGNLVQGNLIGTDATGTADLGIEGDGVHFAGIPVNNTVGGTTAASRNVISGNGGDGVRLQITTIDNHNVISGNFIGTDVTGSAALPNDENGVHIDGGRKNVIGGATAGAGNVISGNGGDGVLIDNTFGGSEEARGNVIQGNLIGTNAAGTAGLGNSIGIHVDAQPDTVIGGTGVGARNVVSGNAIGILLRFGTGAVIQGNFVGTDVTGKSAVANQADGIAVTDGFRVTVGGTRRGAGNVVASNGRSIVKGNGVLVKNSVGVTVPGNSTLGNTLLGIDLGDNGVTRNDPGDLDSSVNELQNFPIVRTAASNGSVTHVTGKLSSQPSVNYLVEFFSSPLCDPSGNGEGKVFLGRTTVTTGQAGAGSFNVVFHVGTKVGNVVTATATTPGGSTSELSKCRKVVSGA